MNKAMYMQQVHYLIKPNEYTDNIDYEKFLKQTKRGDWRPFQICFVLLNIKGIFDPSSTDREIVDSNMVSNWWWQNGGLSWIVIFSNFL